MIGRRLALTGLNMARANGADNKARPATPLDRWQVGTPSTQGGQEEMNWIFGGCHPCSRAAHEWQGGDGLAWFIGNAPVWSVSRTVDRQRTHAATFLAEDHCRCWSCLIFFLSRACMAAAISLACSSRESSSGECRAANLPSSCSMRSSLAMTSSIEAMTISLTLSVFGH